MVRLAGKKRADGTIGRRELVRCLAGATVGLLTACGPSSAALTSNGGGPSTSPPRPVPKAFRGPVAVHSWFDLPDDPRSRELSGLAWDEGTRTMWAVQDETANIVPLVPDKDLRRWSLGPVIVMKTSFPLDLEGIVLIEDGFIVASERGPRILEVDRAGKLRRDIPLPAHFARARENRSIESLAISPAGRYLFTTTEDALASDGKQATVTAGTRVRILRMTRDGLDATEHAYATDPLPHDTGDYGVADLAAMSGDELLVLERGWSRGSGNTARIYRVNISDPKTSCIASDELPADTPVLEKHLVVDFASLTARGLPPLRQIQASPILDNYEGMAIGPVLPDGRPTIVLVSDDNGRTDQFARIVVLAVG
jgi:hypothetical protein